MDLMHNEQMQQSAAPATQVPFTKIYVDLEAWILFLSFFLVVNASVAAVESQVRGVLFSATAGDLQAAPARARYLER